MPYSKPSDAPDWVAKGKKAQWVKVWNSVYAAKKKDGLSDKEAESEAFKQAGGVVSTKHSGFIAAGARKALIQLRGDGTDATGFVTAKENPLPRKCGACHWQADGFCSHEEVMADTELVERRQANGTIRVDDDDCCNEFQNEKEFKKKRSINMKTEYRFLAELRAESQGDEMAIGGYAALFGVQSNDLGGFRETIAPGAFTRSLKENADVKALFNHDPSQILGRTKNGTLTLSQDERGLRWHAVLDPTNQNHKNIYASIKRMDIDECSFAFTVPDGGDDWTDGAPRGNEDWFAMRTLKDVDLMDVSAVTYPAYGGTSVAARCFEPSALIEIRSRVSALRAKAGVERRDEEESLEESIREVCAALNAKYPDTFADGTAVPESYNSGKYWIIETYDDHLIVCAAGQGDDYYQIDYHEDEANESFLFGDPQPVEKQWVPSERAKAIVIEKRHQLDEIIAQHKASAAAAAEQAAAHQKEADAHKAAADALEATKKAYREDYGLLEDEDWEENQMSDPNDVWFEGDDEDVEDENRAAKRTARRTGLEVRADGKVRTKKVGGKNLTKDKFAYVGDPERTETWKLPIHDAAHVRNALARFNQTQGIPADKKAGVYRKIVSAAKKFGIEVSDERSVLASLPMDAAEVDDVLRRARALMVSDLA